MVEKKEFTENDFDPHVSFEHRIELVKFYDSKITANLLRLVTVSIALIGFQIGDLLESLGIMNDYSRSTILVVILAGFLTSIFYFIGRAYYWSIFSTALSSVRSFSESYIIKTYPDWGDDISRYKFSDMTGLVIAAKYECFHSPYLFRRII
jgi:hypothetical protein